MHPRAMQTLVVVLVENLPVRPDLVDDPPARAQSLHVVALVVPPGAELLLQRPWFRRQVDEHEPIPGLPGHGVQPVLRSIEALHLADVRCADQASVQRVGPTVVRADNGGTEPPGTVTEFAAAVPAHAVERAEHPRLSADDQDALVEDLTYHVVTLVRNLFLPPGAEPLLIENPLLLEIEDFRRIIVPRRKRLSHPHRLPFQFERHRPPVHRPWFCGRHIIAPCKTRDCAVSILSITHPGKASRTVQPRSFPEETHQVSPHLLAGPHDGVSPAHVVGRPVRPPGFGTVKQIRVP